MKKAANNYSTIYIKSIIYTLFLFLFLPKTLLAQVGYATSGWNVLVYHEGSDAANLKYYNFNNYLGFYPTPDDAVGAIGALPPCTTSGAGSFSFNTNNDGYGTYSTPSLAPGYVGTQTPAAPFPNDGFTVWAKKTNFVCGYYKVYLQFYDDGSRIKIDQDGDGTPEYTGLNAHPPCTPPGTCQNVVWEGFLGASSKVDIQCFDWFNDNTEFRIHVAFLRQNLSLTATNTGLVCIGQNINLNVTPNPNPTCLPVAYTWTGPNGFSSTLQNPTISSATAAAAGLYTVSVPSSAAACGATPLSATTNVVFNTVNATATVTGNKCEGSNLSFSASPSGGTYAWTGPNGFTSSQKDFIFNSTTLNTGTYTVTVTSGSCAGTASVNVVVTPAPPIVISATPNPICEGKFINISAIPSNYPNYQWSQNVGNVPSFMAQPAPPSALYTLTVTDVNGCTATAIAPVTVNPNPTINVSGNTFICLGGSTTLTGNDLGGNYVWSNGSTSNVATYDKLGAGNVTFTKAGCSITWNFNITKSTTVLAKITAPKKAICLGENIDLEASGAANYIWSDGKNISKINVSPTITTTYVVTVSNNLGCKDTASITIKVNPLPILNIVSNTAFCEGDSIEIKANPSNLAAYSWSNGATKSSFFTKIGGIFSVTASDANGCKNNTQITIVQNPKPNANITGSITFCTGKNTKLTATNGLEKYLWSSGETTSSIIVNTSGVKSVTVTDSKGCKNSSAVTVTENSKLKITINGTDFCQGKSTILDAGTFNTYLWNNGSTQQTLTTDKAGTYCVTVSDGSCTGDTCLIIKALDLPKVAIVGKDSICEGAKTTLALDATFASQIWNFSASANPTINVGEGKYSVTVTAANGCTSSDDFEIVTVKMPNASIEGDSLLCPNEVISLNAKILGSGYAYVWNTKETTPKIEVKKEENYNVTITNSIGCERITDFNIKAGKETITNITQSICENETFIFKGKIYNKNKLSDTIIIKNKAVCDSIFYIKINLKATPKFELKGAKTICSQELVFLTIDANGYAGNFDIEYTADGVPQQPIVNVQDKHVFQVSPSKTTTYVITTVVFSAGDCPPVIGSDVKINVTNMSIKAKSSTVYNGFSLRCVGDKDGKAEVQVINGNAPFTYAWSNGGNSAELPNLATGIYSVTVTDRDGCSAIDNVEITTPKAISYKISTTTPTCTDPKGGSIKIDSIQGGAGLLLLTYTGNGSPETLDKSKIISDLSGGEYSITITDGNGCSNISDVKIAGLGVLVLNLGIDLALELGDSIQLNPTLNFKPKTLIWKNTDFLSCKNCLQPIAKPTKTILYSLTATDSLGCAVSDDLNITVNRKRNIFIPTVFSANDDGTNDRLIIHGKTEAIVKIKSFRIYDRWGDAVFEQTNFQPNDFDYGWDGTYRGRLLNSQVLTYVAEVEFIDGEVLTYKGDVMLLR